MAAPPFSPDLSRATRWLLLAALVLTVAHHADHVLRVDHSGWPFRSKVTPFTFSLLAYPMILFGLFGAPRLFWARWGLLAAGTAMTLYAHSMIETPAMQFFMWARDCSLDPAGAGLRNLLGVRSTVMGVIAVGLGMALNLTACASIVSMLLDGRRRDLSGPVSARP